MLGTALRRWRWLESGLIPLAAATMQVAWVAPLLHLMLNNALVAPTGGRFPAWLVLILLLGASILEDLLQEHPNGPAITTLTGIILIVVALAYAFPEDLNRPSLWLWRTFANLTSFEAGFPAGIIVVLAAALLWRRGMTAEWHDYGSLYRSFTRGVLVMAFLLLVPSSRAWEGADLSMWSSMFVFVLSALLSLALISAYDVLSAENLNPEGSVSLSRSWLVAAVSVVLAVIALGFLVTLLVSPGTVREILHFFNPVWVAIREALLYVVFAVAYVIFWLLGPLLEMANSALSEGLEEVSRNIQDQLEQEMELPEAVPRGLDPALVMALRIILITVLVVGVALALYTAFRRRQRRRRGGVVEERESILSRELLRQQIQDLLERRHRPAEPSPFLPLSGDDPRETIRLLYQNFLGRMSALGRARAPGLTPLAYAGVVADLLPQESQALYTLTEAYLVARYGLDPPTQQDVMAAMSAWERISAQVGA